MTTLSSLATTLVLLLWALSACAQSNANCPPARGVALQVLGSGGPIADDGRASSAYLVWINGKSRILIDAGGGSFLRFGEAGARFADLDFVGLSHFHTDHSADFPALLKSGYFSRRTRSLAVAGPDSGGPFPGLDRYLDALLNSESGAYRYLSGYLDGSGGLARIEPLEVNSERGDARLVYESPDNDVRIEAMHVPHGIVPALGFRVRVGDVMLVFASDQNGSDLSFREFSNGADVLVMHMPIPLGATGAATQLHAPPNVIGEIAAESKVDTLLLSHFMARSLQNFDENVTAVGEPYDGQILIAEDLRCISVQ